MKSVNVTTGGNLTTSKLMSSLTTPKIAIGTTEKQSNYTPLFISIVLLAILSCICGMIGLSMHDNTYYWIAICSFVVVAFLGGFLVATNSKSC